MKFCYNRSFTHPKQSQRSTSVLKTDLDFRDCFGRKKLHFITKEICLITEEIWYICSLSMKILMFCNFSIKLSIQSIQFDKSFMKFQ